MPAVFVESARMMKRRNLAAMLAAIGVSQIVNVPVGTISLTGFAPTVSQSANEGFTAPTGALTLTGFAPTVSQTSGAEGFTAPTAALSLTGFAPTVQIAEKTGVLTQYVHIDRSSVQPRRNVGYQLLAIANPPGAGNTFTSSTASLTLQGYAPVFAQASLVLAGQDTQGDGFAEFWQPQIRSYAFVLQPPGTQSFNVPTGNLALAAFAPTISISGNFLVPTAPLTLAAFAPTFSQVNAGRIDVPLGALSLTGFAPSFGLSGNVFIPTGSLALTGFAPVLTQSTVPAGPPLTSERIAVEPYGRRIVLTVEGRRIMVKGDG